MAHRSQQLVGCCNNNMSSQRLIATEQPFIEDVLDKYINSHSNAVEDLTMLALGSSYWTPPVEALESLGREISSNPVINKYSYILGLPSLRSHLSSMMGERGLSMLDMDIAVTAGANQAFMNTALAVLDSGDNVIIVAPYYFSHKLSCQLVVANVTVCPFDPSTFAPNWEALTILVKDLQPRMIVITTPNNPSGYVWTEPEVHRLVDLCRLHHTWLVADQTYHEFLYDSSSHSFPCGKKYQYDRIAHIFSFSKIFGMPGWRVGYMVYPQAITDSIRKIQDTVPTHTATLSQILALRALEQCYPVDTEEGKLSLRSGRYSAWAESTVGSLVPVRDHLWREVLQGLGAVRTGGAFYFLVPLPPHVTEDEAVDVLARQFGVLLMHGTPFGATNYLRLSYGSIPPSQVLNAVEKLKQGFSHLLQLSSQRSQVQS